MYRRPGYAGRSKASANTLCQKCLKRGHYSYECQAPAQERPYKPRPSRTQQLLNPQLKPKLTTEVPTDLLRKKGIADEILAKKEEERGRKHGRESSIGRSRSVSSDSVSTISTNRSPSRSPPPKRIENEKTVSRRDGATGKRRRRSISSASDRSPERVERHTRRRMSSFSPERRGRRRTRSRSSRMDISHDRGSDRRATREHRSRSRDATRRKGGRRSRSLDKTRYRKRPTRELSVSRSRSKSPNQMDITEDQYGPTRGVSRETLSGSRSRSPYRHVSPSPYSKRRAPRSVSPSSYQNGRHREGLPTGGRQQFHGRTPFPPPISQPIVAEPSPPPRERSLSPYSKRLALTRQMQRGH
ncbi:hypothetical protein DM02DRAFT_232008 [Periconia macrospinosa]|uniref:Uncharacterized protein n=1 Tax=Periconia macrospinosa TaxID=97972 RepID=A0A2V1EAZ9_9PLEO|nr:hypothetical protein DM02DRAFT_232008 [Periconia macrospinosa]